MSFNKKEKTKDALDEHLVSLRNPLKAVEIRLSKHNFKKGSKVVLTYDGRYIPRFTVKKDPDNPIWRTAEKGEILKIFMFSTTTKKIKNLTPEQEDQLKGYHCRNKDGSFTVTVDVARVKALDGSVYDIECSKLRKAEKHEVFLAEMLVKNNFKEEEEDG